MNNINFSFYAPYLNFAAKYLAVSTTVVIALKLCQDLAADYQKNGHFKASKLFKLSVTVLVGAGAAFYAGRTIFSAAFCITSLALLILKVITKTNKQNIKTDESIITPVRDVELVMDISDTHYTIQVEKNWFVAKRILVLDQTKCNKSYTAEEVTRGRWESEYYIYVDSVSAYKLVGYIETRSLGLAENEEFKERREGKIERTFAERKARAQEILDGYREEDMARLEQLKRKGKSHCVEDKTVNDKHCYDEKNLVEFFTLNEAYLKNKGFQRLEHETMEDFVKRFIKDIQKLGSRSGWPQAFIDVAFCTRSRVDLETLQIPKPIQIALNLKREFERLENIVVPLLMHFNGDEAKVREAISALGSDRFFFYDGCIWEIANL